MILNILSFKEIWLSLVCFGIGLAFYFLVLKIMNSQIYRGSLVTKSEELPEFSDKWVEIEELKAEIEKLMTDSWYTTNLEFLHLNYHDVDAVEQMYMIVDEGRALSLAEALNCLLDQRHREETERSYYQDLSETQEEAMLEAAGSYYETTAFLYNDSPFYKEWTEDY